MSKHPWLLSVLHLGLLLAAPVGSQRNGSALYSSFSANDGADRTPPHQPRSRGVKRLPDSGHGGAAPPDRRLKLLKGKSCKGMGKGMKGCPRTRAPTRPRAPTTRPSPPGSPSSAPSGHFCDDLCTCASNGHKYRLVQEKVSWQTANAKAAMLPKCCGGKTAHLVTIDSEEEDFVVSDLIYPFGEDLYAWIGISDLAVDGTFQWVTGEPVTYENWDSLFFDGGLEPNNCGEYFRGTYQWYTFRCSVRQRYIVEYDCDL